MNEPGSFVRLGQAWLRQRWAVLEPWLRRNGLWVAISVAVALASGIVVFVIARSTQRDADAVVAPARSGDSPSAVPTTPAEPAREGNHQPGAIPLGALSADAGQERSPNVQVVFKTYPPRRATVMWGGKRLGFIERGKSLVVERPRDSGPMDVVIRSPGYLPVHARAYTFDDAVVDVRITPVDKKDTIYGYREPLPPDAGAPLE